MADEAKDVVAELVAKETWSTDDHRQLLVNLFEQHDAPDKWRRVVARLEEDHPEAKGAAALKLGIARFMLCRFAEAIEALVAATDNKDRRFFQGLCLKGMGQFARAVEEFERAKARGWEGPQADLELVECMALAGQGAEAGKALKKIKSAAGTADGVYLQGLVDELAGLGEQAVAAYEQALEIDPEHAGAAFRLAYWLDLHGEEGEAMDLYRQCLSRPPIYANALINLAVLYEDMGQFDLAAASLRRLLACNPQHARARLFLKDAEASKTMHYDEDQARRIAKRNALLDIPVTDFELSVRARNCLKKMEIRTLGDLVRTTEAELLGYKNFGETSLKEIKDMLSAKGLRLGQALEEGSEFGDLLPPEASKAENEGVLATPLEQIELSVRARKALENLTVRTLGDLAQKSEAELLACRNFGQTSLNEIRQRLTEYGLRLREPN